MWNNYPALAFFRHLLSLHDLEQVVVDYSCTPPSTSDKDILDFAASWPKLRKFSLHHDSIGRPPTLQTVVTFVRLCPGLTELILAEVDASFLPTPCTSSPSSRARCNCWIYATLFD
ncbi:hypothetical protein SCP_0413300 [Sparassis crispa]|uniref:F-box domain-containing protein n=1 Tax=Sparassis crispa TaxID=139825 RepID=A0A401GL94_9APHY|nr:hypothetical protein SCP_0413300 [Sparassis crispa]GBE82943.1 hypothetical protein SCP_0413300 [Sparassis crispa]